MIFVDTHTHLYLEQFDEDREQMVQRAIEAANPKARYLVAVPFANRLALWLGDSVRDAALKRMFKITSSVE